LIDVLTIDSAWSTLVDRLAQAASAAVSVDRASALWLVVARIQSDELGDIGAAIRTLQRVLKVEPRHLEALERLAAHFESNESWHEAAASMEQLLAAAPGHQQARRVQINLSRIYRARLDAPDKARRHVESALDSNPHDPAALRELSLVHEALGNVSEALEVTRQLLEIGEGDARADAWVRLGQLEHTAGDDDRAKSALRRAVVIGGPGSEASQTLEALCETPDDWRLYAEALAQYETTDEARRIETGLEVARILSDHCRDDHAAIEALQIRIEPGETHADLRRELAARLRSRGESAAAVEQLQAVLCREPLRAECWRELAITYEANGRAREARIASLPLATMGVDDERDRARIASVPAKPARARPRSLRGDVLDQLGTPRSEDAAAGALLTALAPSLAKLFPAELQSYGLTTRDRLATEANHPLREIVNQLAAALAIRHVDLFLHRVRNRDITIELGTHPAILVPATIMEKDARAQTFALARPMTQIARGYQAVEKLTPRELDVLLASAARIVRPDFGHGLTSEDVLNEQTRRLQRAIPRRDRKAVRDAAQAYAEARRVKFDRWVHAAQRTATRVALLLCDDLEPLVSDLQSHVAPEPNGELASLESQPAYLDALRFWASPAAMHLREHVGLLLP
jgi:tetratricopeptide (TPR) repeat protein